jgi:hypothetical protein
MILQDVMIYILIFGHSCSESTTTDSHAFDLLPNHASKCLCMDPIWKEQHLVGCPDQLKLSFGVLDRWRSKQKIGPCCLFALHSLLFWYLRSTLISYDICGLCHCTFCCKISSNAVIPMLHTWATSCDHITWQFKGRNRNVKPDRCDHQGAGAQLRYSVL